MSMVVLWYFLWDFYWIPVGFHGSSMIFLWDYYWISMGCRLYFYGIPMGIQKDVCGIYIGILWDFHDVSMIFLGDFYGISMGCYENSMVFSWESHWITMGVLRCLCDVSMGFLWDYYGVPMAFLWEFHDVSILLWDHYGIPEGILWDSLGNSMGFF